MLINIYLLDDILIWNNNNLKSLKTNKYYKRDKIKLIDDILNFTRELNIYNNILVFNEDQMFDSQLIEKIKKIKCYKQFSVLNLDKPNDNFNIIKTEISNSFILNIKNHLNNVVIYDWVKELFSFNSKETFTKNIDILENLIIANKIILDGKKQKFYTDKVYVLYNSDEEYNRFTSYVNSLPFKIKYIMFKSVRKDKYDKSELNIFNKDIKQYLNWYKSITKDELVLNKNMLSHIYSFIEILKDALICNYKSITILEYDILFHNSIENLLPNYYNLISKNDIIYLGSSQNYWINPINHSYIEIINNHYKANHSMGTFGIILKKNVFEIFIKLLEKYILPTDVCLSIISKHTNSIVLYPNLIICDISNSTIKSNNRKRNLELTFQRFRWNMNDYKISLLNRYFDRIYVINMKKDVEKRRNIIEIFSKHNIIFDFFEGIDGNDDSIKLEYESIIKKNITSRLKSPNAYAYSKTMLNIFLDAKNKNYKNILICDDDCIFIKNFNEKLKKIQDINLNDIYMIKFGSTQHVWKEVDLKFANNNNFYYTPYHTDGSFAVGYNFKIFDDIINNILLFETTFDSGPLRYIYKTYPNSSITFYPNLIIADVSKSSISTSRNQIEIAEKLRWNMEKYDYAKYINLKVTVIISVYNSEYTILDAIQSIVNQTYNNKEVIIVDDCSTDNTYSTIKNYIDNNKFSFRIKLIQSKGNGGCYVCRNIALRESRGDLITFQDADDISLSTRLEKQVFEMINHNVDIVFCGIYRINDTFLHYDTDSNLMEIVNKEKNNDNWFFKIKLGIVTSLIKKELFDKYGYYREDYRHSSDLELIERIFCHKNNINPFRIDHMHTIIGNNNAENFCYYSDELLYLCNKMNKNNISNQYQKEEKRLYEIKWKNDILEKQANNIVVL